jgi:hypothetical protein
MKQTIEERREKQKIIQKRYRDNMSPEMKAKVAASKKISAAKYKEKIAAARVIYYQNNKEAINKRTFAYHKIQRELAKIIKDKDQEYKNLIAIPTPRKVSVVPRDVTTIKEEAAKLGISTMHLRHIQKDNRFNMPAPKLLRVDGIELFCIFAWADWLRVYKEPLAQESISGALNKRKGQDGVGITLDSNVMMIIGWRQASKHVTEYCNKQRVAINSNQFWARR